MLGMNRTALTNKEEFFRSQLGAHRHRELIRRNIVSLSIGVPADGRENWYNLLVDNGSKGLRINSLNHSSILIVHPVYNTAALWSNPISDNRSDPLSSEGGHKGICNIKRNHFNKGERRFVGNPQTPVGVLGHFVLLEYSIHFFSCTGNQHYSYTRLMERGNILYKYRKELIFDYPQVDI